MERYLKHGLVLFAVWIIVTRIMSLVYLALTKFSLLMTYGLYYNGANIITGLLGLVAGVVIIVELSGTDRGMRRIAMTCLGLMLMVVGVYGMLFHILFNFIIAQIFVTADIHVVLNWVLNVLRAAHGVTALLILVSLQEEGAVARMGLFLYSVVTIAGIAFQFFGMGGNPASGAVLALLGIVSAVLILKRM